MADVMAVAMASRLARGRAVCQAVGQAVGQVLRRAQLQARGSAVDAAYRTTPVNTKPTMLVLVRGPISPVIGAKAGLRIWSPM